MYRIVTCFICFCIALIFSKTYGQVVIAQKPVSNFRTKTIKVNTGEPIIIDTVSIVPGTFKVEGYADSSYTIDLINALLYWHVIPVTDTVAVSYRIFSVKLNQPVRRMRFDSLLMYSGAPVAPPALLPASERNLFNFGNINAQGSFGRQVGFGNNQDMVLNSNLNVQISGFLADSIELQAAITDNNIAIQPDGNTQQLNEFDEVYIRFRKHGWNLNLGDMDIRENRSYFLNFYKRLQGISFQTINNISKNVISNTLVSGAVAKGKFTRNIFNGLEGNQGPYRLSGANGELFFVVLANTERVFIDGELLQRGEDQDYVINYNTAEVTFTPRRMITKDSRIQIEFEYADRNFLNTNVFAMQELDIHKKLKLRIGIFNNSDAKNASIQQVLDAKQKQFLSQIGDSIQNAYYPSVSIDTFSAGRVLYELVYDSVAGVIVDSFYRYSVDPLKAKYSLGFTDVGLGRGNYIPAPGNANGKVFTYIPSVNGIKQGNYEPVLLLVTPKRHQLLTLGADYNISKNTIVKAEVAASNRDVNTLSQINNGDDKGYAAKVGFANTKLLRTTTGLQLRTSLDYEFVQDKFQPLERLRNVEFSRDWGLPLIIKSETENILKATAALSNTAGSRLLYAFTNYNRGSNYKGFQNALYHNMGWKNWAFNNEMVLTNYNAGNYKGYFLRPVLDIRKKLEWLYNWSVGARYTLEENNNRNKFTDTLNHTAFSFDTYSVFLKSNEAAKNKYSATFFTRSDQYPVYKNFIRGDRSYNVNLQAEILANAKRQFYLNTTFRKLKVYDSTISNQQEDNTILGRAEYVMNEWNGFLTGNVLYEVGSGQEQKREYAYIEVPAGRGQYTWIDYNNDGVQQLNEFEIAAFQDQAKFIRIFTPTNEYIKANYTTLNYSFNFAPKQLWKTASLKGGRKFLSRFNYTTSLQISRKSTARGSFEFNPFIAGVNDPNLITLNTVFLNMLSFNRQSTVWGIDVNNIRSGSKALLTYGYESRRNMEWSVKYRHALSSSITFNMNGVSGFTALYSNNVQFENRNYEIRKMSAEPVLTYISGTSFRLAGGYKFEVKKNNVQYGGEKVIGHSLLTETKYNILQSASVTSKFNYQGLHYKSNNGNQTTVSYIMLDGLQSGQNFLWNLTLTKRLFNNLELNLQYDGRKPGSIKTIHTGRASVTALF